MAGMLIRFLHLGIYLVCLTWTKKPLSSLLIELLVVRLPGRTLAKNDTVWLRNAHRADTKVFSRSLLAKASERVVMILCYLFYFIFLIRKCIIIFSVKRISECSL